MTKPEWPLVLRNEKFGQTDYLSALFPEGSDNFLGAQNGLVRVFSNKRNVNWDENPGRDLLYCTSTICMPMGPVFQHTWMWDGGVILMDAH